MQKKKHTKTVILCKKKKKNCHSKFINSKLKYWTKKKKKGSKKNEPF